jgi:hypothetical protein
VTNRNRDEGARTRVSQPEWDDESVCSATGRDRDEWCHIIDAWPGHGDGHGGHRRPLFPGRTPPTARTLCVAIGPGTAQFAVNPARGGKTKVTVTHERLPSPESQEWKVYWSEWLTRLDEA